MSRWRWLALAALAPLAAQADVLLDGYQHIGDNEAVSYTPSDPVTLNEYSNSASRFYLSQSITVTAVQLSNYVYTTGGANRTIRIELDGVLRTATNVNGLLTLTLSRTLGAGVHTIALDPGCLRSGIQQFANACRTQDDEYDIGFSALTLVTSSASMTSTARNLTRRRHLGDTTDSTNNNFGDNYYPDAPEASTLDTSFTIDATRRLNEIRFYRLREVGTSGQVTSRAQVSVVNSSGGVTALGTLTGNGNPFIITPASQPVLAAGTYSIRVTAGQSKTGFAADPNNDDVRWNDIILLMTDEPSSTPGLFNAVDTAADPVTGVITTKVAGSPLNVDIVAISNGALVPTYVGNVTVYLVDATSDSGGLDTYGCRSSWTQIGSALATVTFSLTDAGRRQLQTEVAEAYPKVRLRMVDSSLGVSGCSTDVFAIRPNTFTLLVTDDTPVSAGTTRTLNAVSAGASPTHKAGQPFTIQATAINADGQVTANYSGSPTVLASSSVLGGHLGEARADLWTTTAGLARTDLARYNEAGAVALEVRDTTFAVVDSADGSTTAQREIGPVTVNIGRFTPDHFEVSLNTPEFTPGCSGNFTYLGQAFAYAVAPVATLTAVAYGVPVTTTQNYNTTDGLYSLPATLAQSTYAANYAIDLSSVPAVDATVAPMGSAGVATVTLTAGNFAFQRTTPVAAFDAEIQVTTGTIADSDSITTESPVVFGGTATGSGVAFTGGAKQIRFGRLVVDNAHGSEQLPLNVPLRTEYFASVGGQSGFVSSTGDSCTVLANTDVPVPTLFPAGTTGVSAVVMPDGTGAGTGYITLSAPNPKAAGYATVTVNLSPTRYPWLRGDWDNDGIWNEDDNDPSGRASFGLFKSNDRRVYQREVIGN